VRHGIEPADGTEHLVNVVDTRTAQLDMTKAEVAQRNSPNRLATNKILARVRQRSASVGTSLRLRRSM
jgi:hypothetical protein